VNVSGVSINIKVNVSGVSININPLDAKPFSLISAKGFLVKFVYREVMTLSV
jgi:hypothetical protein